MNDDLPATNAGASASVEATIVGPEGSQISPRLEAGRRVGRYVVLERIGAGAMGEVVAAYDPELDRKVALKLMRASTRGGVATATARARLLREAQALARLSHPNVVAVHDVGVEGEGVFVAMEFVRGRTLDHWIEVNRPSWRGIVELFLQAGRGLAAAHEAGLVHRDFKPKNVMVGDDGRVRVMDFGIVRTADPDIAGDPSSAVHDRAGQSDTFDVALTGAGQRIGTPAYMAPEQHAGAASDARADQFAFCVALFEALHRQRPFPGDTPAEIAAAVTRGRLREPAARTGVPAWIQRAIVRGLAILPRDRHPSMTALMAALDGSRGRKRRRVALAVGVLAIATMVPVSRWGLRRSALARCEEDSRALANSWGSSQREAARSALLATELPYAATAADTIETLLAEHGEAWADASRRVCAHARVDDDWPSERVELAQQCLAEQRGRATALLELLIEADAIVAQGATTSAYSLGSPAGCADPAELAHRTNLLRVGGDHDEVAAEFDALDRVDVLVRGGKHDEARRTVDTILARADALASDLLRARALLVRGNASSERGDPKAAAEDLEEAFFTAMRLGYDELAVNSALSLAQVCGAQLARFDDAERWARQADAILTRLGIADGLQRASLVSALGVVATERGDFATAVDHHERAVAMLRERLGPDHPDVAQALDDLGSAYFEQGRLEESFARLEEVLAIRRRAYGDDHPIVAGSHNDLGVAYLERGDVDRAEVHLRRAIEMRERFHGRDSTRLAGSLANLAQVYDQKKRYQDAIVLLERALEIRTTMLGEHHPSVAQVLSNLAGEHARLGHLDQAQQQYERALEIQERALGPDHSHTAYVREGLADIAARRGDHRGAVEHLRRALAVRESANVASWLVASTLIDLAGQTWRSGEKDEALRLALRARSVLEPAAATQPVLRKTIEKWLAEHRRGGR